MRAPTLRQFLARPRCLTALAAAVCALGGCVTSPQREQYNRHLTTIVQPAGPAERAELARLYGFGDEPRRQLADGQSVNGADHRADARAKP